MNWCPTDASAFDEAVKDLRSGSNTANNSISSALANNVTINIIKFSNSAGGATDGYHNDQSKTIDWDPFGAGSGGSGSGAWSQSPVVALAHEFAHAANPGMTEAQVINITNTIARELNTSFGWSESTNRTDHNGSLYNVDKVNGRTLTIQRPDCP